MFIATKKRNGIQVLMITLALSVVFVIRFLTASIKAFRKLSLKADLVFAFLISP